jgi:hypothetical protein
MTSTPPHSLPLSSLTRAGLGQFRKLVGAAPGMSIPMLEQKILEIAGGARTASIVDANTAVSVFPALESRQQTAEIVAEILASAGIEAGPSSGHDTLFSWLALVFLPSLCRRTKSGTAATGKMYRYILTRSTSDFYRHLVACPYWLHRRYGKSARIFLAQEAFVMPDVVEQIASRPSLIDSPGVVKLIDRFYWDESTNSPKDGFTATIRMDNPPPGYAKTSPNPGTLRAFEWTLGQLQCTYDLRSMSAEQILEKLPPEFDAWKNGTPA